MIICNGYLFIWLKSILNICVLLIVFNAWLFYTVTWEDAQHICNVPSSGDIMYTRNNGFGESTKSFTAWTSSMKRTSDWTTFYGMLKQHYYTVNIDNSSREICTSDLSFVFLTLYYIDVRVYLFYSLNKVLCKPKLMLHEKISYEF